MKKGYTGQHHCESGASLIALAFLILVMSFMGSAGVYLYKSYDVVQDEQVSVDNTRDIQAAILAFVDREGRYPCPAPLDAEIDSTEYGKEVSSTNCLTAPLGTGTFRAIGRANETVRIGTIPTRSLNISDDKMVDGYKKRYIYAVTERMATPGTDPHSEHGVISVQNTNGDDISSIGGRAIYALLTFGEDDRGAYDITGQQISPCNNTSDAGQNCQFQTVANSPATFMTTLSKSFTSEGQGLEHSYAFFANDVPYRWNTGPWDECTGICFSGTQDRTVDCRNLNNGDIINVSDSNLNNPDANPCIHTPKPETNRVCSLGPCEWRAGAYGACQAAGNVRIPDRRNCEPE